MKANDPRLAALNVAERAAGSFLNLQRKPRRQRKRLLPMSGSATSSNTGGHAHRTVQPTILATTFIKL